MTQNPDLKLLLALLTTPVIPQNIPLDLLYQTASIGAIAMLSEAVEKSPQENKQEIIQILRTAVKSAVSEELQKRAFAVLIFFGKKNDADAIQAVFDLAIQDRNELALEAMRQYDFQLPDPEQNSAKYWILNNREGLKKIDPELRFLTKYFLQSSIGIQNRLLHTEKAIQPNWMIIAAYFQSISSGQPDTQRITKNYGSFSDQEKLLFVETMSESFIAQRSIIADFFLQYGDPISYQACMKYQLRPQDPDQHAVFFFLTEQWDLYNQSDFEYRKIRKTFIAADDVFKRRLILISRKTGHVAWLRDLDASVQFQTERKTLSLSQWFELIQSLQDSGKMQKLWELLPIVPFCFTPMLYQILESASFFPQNPEEINFFTRIGNMMNTLPQTIPVPLVHRYFSQKKNPIQLCISPDSEHLAASFLNDEIQIWNIRDRRIPPISLNSCSSFRAMSFSMDGSHLLTATRDNRIQIFQIPSGRMIKSIPSQKMPLIGLFVDRDNKRFYTVDQAGFGAIWGFPHGTLIREFNCQTSDLLRVSFDSENSRIIILRQNGKLTCFDPNKSQTVSSFMTAPDNFILGQNHQRGLVTCGSSSNRISCWNLMSQKAIIEDTSPEIDDRILSILDILPGEICALGTQSGTCSIFNLCSGSKMAEIYNQENAGAITAMQISSDCSTFFLARMNSEITEWDLTLFHWFTKTYSILEIPSAKELDDFLNRSSLPAVKNSVLLMKAIADWRRRFDIEIEFSE